MLLRDIRYALRQLRNSPGFTLTAVLTLAFGIGATTAIFSIVEGVLLRPLPFADPGRLVILGDAIEGAGMELNPSVPAPEFVTYARDTHGFSSTGAYQQTGFELSGAGDPEQINATRLTASIFPTLGVSPSSVAPSPSRRTMESSRSLSSATRCGAGAFMATRILSAKRSNSTENRTRSSA